MGLALKVGLIIALIGAVVVFRDQIGKGFGAAGASLGSGLNQGISSFFAEATKGAGDFFFGGGALGQYFREQGSSSTTKTYVPNEIKIAGSGSTKSDVVITPQTRETSDVLPSWWKLGA